MSARRHILGHLRKVGRPLTPRELADALDLHVRSVENECSLLRSTGVLSKVDGNNGGYYPAVPMLPGDREIIADLVAAYGARAVRRAAHTAEAKAALHPNGACTCFGEGRCEWCIDTSRRLEAEERDGP